MEQLQKHLSFSPSTDIPLLLLTFTAILLATNLLRKSKIPPPPLPPGPWKLPILGNLHQLALTPFPPHRRLRDMAEKYGPVMQLQLGELLHVVVSSPEAARDVLRTHDAVLASRPFVLAADIFFYGRTGISFTPYGDYWRRVRKICVMELLSDRRVLSYRAVREDELCGSMVRRVAAAAATTVDLGEILYWASNRVITRSAFGALRENTESFLAVVNSMSDALSGLSVSDLYPSIRFLPWLTGFRAKLTALHREADLILEEIINEHKARRGNHDDRSAAAAAVDDILDVLLDLQEAEDCNSLESPLTNDNIKAVATELFLAGSGTASVTIEWIMSEIMRNPRVLRKVQEEVRRTFRGKGKVDEQGLDDLKYMNAVIKEVLRLHPDGPLLAPRESQEDLVVGGYLVPARTKVMVNVWAIGRDSRSWGADAEKFDPERFLDCSVDYKGRDFQFLPFGGGRRICAGISFGMAIVKLGLANLLYHFDWELPGKTKPEDLDMTERFGLTLRRNSPLCLVPIAFNPAS
ncbi:unnamed protein product [Linum tenue]|uniref:Cytochrome P450 n=1 Tax=Linum tenue TaxID=586396 RepID=A0AAV0M2D3_9ROSI|nr:unnamed protein product [Linum tenue]